MPDAIVTINEAAAYLRCHHDTVRSLIRKGKLPAANLKIGTGVGKGALRIRMSDINNLFRVETKTGKEATAIR